MSAPERSIIAAEFEIAGRRPGEEPSGKALVAAAARGGFDRVVVHARSTADGWAVVHANPTVRLRNGDEGKLADLTLAEARTAICVDGRISTLEDTMLEAHRRKLGLVIRIEETFVIGALAGALGIMAGDGHGELRRRYLVIVPNARIGKRLRADAEKLPSARSLPHDGGGWRAALARRYPNFARAAADADDLVVHTTLASPDVVRNKLVPLLGRRGAYVWVEGVTNSGRAEYEDIGAGGLLVETPYAE